MACKKKQKKQINIEKPGKKALNCSCVSEAVINKHMKVNAVSTWNTVSEFPWGKI